MNFRVNWTQLKSFISSKQISLQYLELDDQYIVFASEGIFSVYYQIIKTDPANDDQTDFEDNFKAAANKSLSQQQSAFASKTFGSKKLYKRVHGISTSVVQGSNEILFTIPYPWVKITGLEVVGGESLDSVSLYILDTTTGTYSTVPNYVLNQFGFTVQISKDYYSHKSEFDADLYQNMQIKMVYISNSAKSVGFNFILNEVK